MALPVLAGTTDLSARNIASDGTLPATMLAVASASVRRAAAAPILEATSTVDLTGWVGEPWLRLPGPPVRSVAEVLVDGSTASGWRLAGGRLWRRGGWGCDDGPAQVQVTLTHGLPTVPADIIDLVCSLAAAGIAAAADGYEAHGGVVTESIDDYSVTYARGAEAVATVMELPQRTRHWLRTAFGGGVGMVTYR